MANLPSPQTISFKTADGLTLRGTYYPISSPTPSPVIIMTQGLTLLKEHYIPSYAQKYRASGIATLLYDHRGWGSSDPQDEADPQWHAVSVHVQANDYHDAVIFAQTLEGVDSARIAIWGIGHSGGAAMVAASRDPNIRAVVLDMPLLSGARDASAWPAGLLEKAWQERRALTQNPNVGGAFVKVWDDSEAEARGPRNSTFIHGSLPYNFISGALKSSSAAGTPWHNSMRLQSLIDLSSVEPWEYMKRISPRPLLLVSAAVDPLSGPIEAMREAFESARDPKTMIELPKSHLENYFEGFEEHLRGQVEWVKEAL